MSTSFFFHPVYYCTLETKVSISYAQVWTFSLKRSPYYEELIDNLTEVTQLYVSSLHLRSGLRRHHVKRVLVWIEVCTSP